MTQWTGSQMRYTVNFKTPSPLSVNMFFKLLLFIY